MKCIILIAAPAAGKGTIAKYIEDKYGYKHISTGDLLRSEASKDTELGKEIKSLIDEGKFVSDEVMMKVFEETFKNMKDNVILDGMPRTLNQGKLFEELANNNDDVTIDKVIYIDIDKNIAIDRIINRASCENCGSVFNKNLLDTDKCTKCGGNLVSRNDDNLDTYLKRYDTFIKETKPLVDFYKDKVITIENNSTLEDMFMKVDQILGDD